MVQKRRHPRAEFDSALELQFDDDRQPGQSLNISQGGLLVKVAQVPPSGSKVVVALQLPGVNKLSEIPCIVRWVNSNEEVGLQFERLRAIEIWAINKLMREATII